MATPNEAGLEVKYAVLHGGVYIPQAGTVGPTISLDATSSKVIKMTIRNVGDLGQFLVLTAKDPNGNAIKDKALVPLTNVTHFIPA